jgi:hypothetical protein
MTMAVINDTGSDTRRMFMKNIYGSIAAVVVSLCMILGAHPVFAEDTATGQSPTEQSASVEVSKNLYLTIGLKLWAAEWQTAFTSAGGDHIISTTAKAQPVLIPTLAIKYKDVFISGGYFNTTKFDFQKFSEIVNFGPPTGFAVETTTGSAKRTEKDLNIGLSIYRSIAVSLGYKEISQKYHTTFSVPGFNDFTSDSETKYTGPTIGILASAPIGREGLGIYENFSFGQMKAKYTGQSETDDAVYISSELGFTYRAGVALFSLGYKYQALDTTNKNTKLVGADVTKGFIFGCNFVF